jgi:hypothetical protein
MTGSSKNLSDYIYTQSMPAFISLKKNMIDPSPMFNLLNSDNIILKMNICDCGNFLKRHVNIILYKNYEKSEQMNSKITQILCKNYQKQTKNEEYGCQNFAFCQFISANFECY